MLISPILQKSAARFSIHFFYKEATPKKPFLLRPK